MANHHQLTLSDLGTENASKALNADAEFLFQILADSKIHIVRAALKNPNLNKSHLLHLLKRKSLTENLINEISRHEEVKKCHQLKVALVKHPKASGHIFRTFLTDLRLFELVDLCFVPGVTPEQKHAAEHCILKKLPLTELGNKATLARRGTPKIVGEILKGGEAFLVNICLDNKRIHEIAILEFINSRNSSAETISMIARHPIWNLRPNVKLSILKNPKTPLIWFTLILPQIDIKNLSNLLDVKNLRNAQKELIREEISKRLGS